MPAVAMIVLLPALQAAGLIFGALSAGVATVLAATIAGVFLVLNTAITLYVSRPRDRRRKKRPHVMSRGPIIVGLEILSAVTGVCAVVALVIALSAQQDQINTIQDARQNAAQDSCRILSSLILSSGRLSHRQLEARRFLQAEGLADCARYALRVKEGK